MSRKLLALGCALAVLLPGCAFVAARESAPPENALRVYYSAAGDEQADTAVDCTYFAPPEGGEVVPALMDALLAQPEEANLGSPFPAGVQLLSWSVEERVLHLDLSEQYSGLSGVDLSLADCCIALTFCQLDGVDAVYVTVEGRELPYRSSQLLHGEDILTSGGEDMPVHMGVNLWYPRTEGDGLGVEYRQVLKTEGNTLTETVLAAWVEGPKYNSLRACLPEGTQVRSVTILEGTCTVDLSAAFVEHAPADQEEAKLTLYALVNTLCGLEQTERVRLLVEGEALSDLSGVQVGDTLLPDQSLENY